MESQTYAHSRQKVTSAHFLEKCAYVCVRLTFRGPAPYHSFYTYFYGPSKDSQKWITMMIIILIKCVNEFHFFSFF